MNKKELEKWKERTNYAHNGKGINYFQATFEEIDEKELSESEEDGKGGTFIRGYASTTDTDRYNDVVEASAFRESIISTYRENPIVLFQHNQERPIGYATFVSIDEKGLYFEARIFDEEVEPKIGFGILRAFSIGYIPTEVVFKDENGRILDESSEEDRMKIWFDPTVKRIIKKLDLVEVSVVSVPANPSALFTLQKSVYDYFESRTAEAIEKELKSNENLGEVFREKIQMKYKSIENIINKNMKKLVKKENLLLVKKEAEGEKVEEVSEKMPEEPTEVVEEVETVEESSKVEEVKEAESENSNIETESETETVEEVEKNPSTETAENAEVAEKGEEVEEKSFEFDLKLCEPENVKKMIDLISLQEKKISELEERINKIPAKEALSYHSKFSETKKQEVEEKAGFKNALFENAN